MNALLYFFASIILTIYANNSNSTEYDKCGIANKEKITPRIFGGAVVSNNKYPWMAAVVRKSNNVDWRCGGSLISSNAIITAAHCVHGVKEDRLQVILGTNDIKSNDMRVRKNVKYVYPHYGFEPHSYNCDIAILILEENVTFSENIRPICLPPKHKVKTHKYVAAGWGRTENKTKSRFLRDVAVTRLPLRICTESWRRKGYNVSRNIICAGDIGKDTCRGDSGGPLMQLINGTYYLVGVTSFGELNCGTTNDSVYTKIRCYDEWIKMMITSVDGTIDYDY